MNQNNYAGRNVLVTGAGGSIGSALCREVVAGGAAKLTMISLTESGLYQIDRRLKGEFPDRTTELVPVLGSCGDSDLLQAVTENVDLVVHAAAHKHVPLCESNPIAAICNNVFGTNALLAAAASRRIGQVCVVSSDKAVNPTSIMGATKRVVEKLATTYAAIFPDTRFCVVRFGNVLDSAGSVLPLWREQIMAGLPITLTDERCARFFMSIAEAVGLISTVIHSKQPSGTYIFKMEKLELMTNVALSLMNELNHTVPIKIIGLRPGEKLTEELHHGGELLETSVPRVMRVDDANCGKVDDGIIALLQAVVAKHYVNEANAKFRRARAIELLWELAR